MNLIRPCCEGWMHHRCLDSHPDILDAVDSAKDFEFLVKAGAKVRLWSIWRYTVELGGSDLQIIQKLKEKGADINYRSFANPTILMVLARDNKIKPLEAVLNAGAYVAAVEFSLLWGHSNALDYALREDADECAITLILHNSPFNSRYTNKVAKIAETTFATALYYRELHGRFPSHMRRPVGNPFPIKPFIQNCED